MEDGKIRRVAIDDSEPMGYKPTRRTVRAVLTLIANSTIVGFGPFGFNNYYYLLVYSPDFPPVTDQLLTISYKQLISAKTKLKLAP